MSEPSSHCVDWFLWEFFKGVPGGITIGVVAGVAMLFAKDVFEAWRARVRLRSALRNEAETATVAVENMVASLRETIGPSKALVAEVAQPLPQLTYQMVTPLYAGWILYVPQISLIDIAIKLGPSEAKRAICYLDSWARLAEVERRYGATHSKMVELTSKASTPGIDIQLRETVGQLDDYLNRLIKIGGDVIDQASKLQNEFE